MKTRVAAALAILTLPILSFGQSTLSFPRVLQPQDFNTTGFAIVNSASAPASVLFTVYDAKGQSQYTTSQTVPAGGQYSRLASEIFPGAAVSGWVEVTSATPGLHGFFFAGDLTTYADGAEAAASSAELVLPLISPQSEIHIANTGSSEITVLLNLLGLDGFDLAIPYPQHIPAKGFFKGEMAALFALEDLSLPSHMRITCKCPGASTVAATVIARDLIARPSWAVRNGVPAANTATTIYFPHTVEGFQGTSDWRSLLGLTNLSSTSANDVTITFVPESGGTGQTRILRLPPNGGLRFPTRDLFTVSPGFQNGWMRVSSNSGQPLTGYIAYADVIAAGVAVVPPQQDPQPNLTFAHIADLPPWLTGLALLNTNTDTANVEVVARNPNGSPIGSISFPFGPGTSTARLLREMVPQTQNRTSDGGFVVVRSDLPIFGIELFFSRNLRVLANVPGAATVP